MSGACPWGEDYRFGISGNVTGGGPDACPPPLALICLSAHGGIHGGVYCHGHGLRRVLLFVDILNAAALGRVLSCLMWLLSDQEYDDNNDQQQFHGAKTPAGG